MLSIAFAFVSSSNPDVTCGDVKQSWKENGCCSPSNNTLTLSSSVKPSASMCTQGNFLYTSGTWGNARRSIARVGDDKLVGISQIQGFHNNPDPATAMQALKTESGYGNENDPGHIRLESYSFNSEGVVSLTKSCNLNTPSNANSQSHTKFASDGVHVWYIYEGILYRCDQDCGNQISVSVDSAPRHYGVYVYGDHVYAMLQNGGTNIGVFRAKKDLTDGRFFPVGEKSSPLASSNGMAVTDSHILTLTKDAVVTVDLQSGTVTPVTSSLEYPWRSYSLEEKPDYNIVAVSASNALTVNGNAYILVTDSPTFDPSNGREVTTRGMKRVQVYKLHPSTSSSVVESCEVSLPFSTTPLHLMEAFTVDENDERKAYVSAAHAYDLNAVFMELDLSGLSVTGGVCVIARSRSYSNGPVKQRTSPVSLNINEFVPGRDITNTYDWLTAPLVMIGFFNKGFLLVSEGTHLSTVHVSDLEYADRMLTVLAATDTVGSTTVTTCEGKKKVYKHSSACCGKSGDVLTKDSGTWCTSIPPVGYGETGSWDDLTDAQKSSLSYGGSCYVEESVGKWIWTSDVGYAEGANGATYITPTEMYGVFAQYGVSLKTLMPIAYVGDGEADYSPCDRSAPPPPPSACAGAEWIVKVADSYGDGWNDGSYLTVMAPGSPTTNYSLPGGSSNSSAFCVTDASTCIELKYNGIGTWHTENSVTLTLNGVEYEQTFSGIGDAQTGYVSNGKFGYYEFSLNSNGFGCGTATACKRIEDVSTGEYVPC